MMILMNGFQIRLGTVVVSGRIVSAGRRVPGATAGNMDDTATGTATGLYISII